MPSAAARAVWRGVRAPLTLVGLASVVFLVGVFTDGTAPVAPAPARLTQALSIGPEDKGADLLSPDSTVRLHRGSAPAAAGERSTSSHGTERYSASSRSRRALRVT